MSGVSLSLPLSLSLCPSLPPSLPLSLPLRLSLSLSVARSRALSRAPSLRVCMCVRLCMCVCVDLRWNKRVAELTGFTRDEVIGQKLVDNLILDGYQESVRQVLHDVFQGTLTTTFEVPLRTKDRKDPAVRVMLNATTRRDVDRNIVGFFGVGHDITDRVRLLNEIRHFLDTANAPVFGVDTHERVNEWNLKMAEITGFTRDDVMGRKLSDLPAFASVLSAHVAQTPLPQMLLLVQRGHRFRA